MHTLGVGAQAEARWRGAAALESSIVDVSSYYELRVSSLLLASVLRLCGALYTYCTCVPCGWPAVIVMPPLKSWAVPPLI